MAGAHSGVLRLWGGEDGGGHAEIKRTALWAGGRQIPSNNKCIAYSKMLVLQNNPINTFHIDMDMIFRNPQTLIDYLAQDFDGSAWDEEVALIEHNGGYKTTLDTLNKFTSNIFS